MPNKSGVAEQRARLGRGEQLEAGWCFNPDRNPDVFECDEEEQKIAKGEVSVSWDGRTVTDLATGEVTTRNQPKRYQVNIPVTLAEVAEAGGGQKVETTGADDVTGSNAGAGNVARSTVRNARS